LLEGKGTILALASDSLESIAAKGDDAGLSDIFETSAAVARRFRPEQEAALFLSRWIKAPQLIGSVAPSSRGLARAMAREIDPAGTGIVVELGGGTGSITRALLERGLAPGRLVVVECDWTLAALLRKRFPGVKVVRGDAAELRALLRGLGVVQVDTVVSSLPLLSMPRVLRRRIVEECFGLLDERGAFVQYTYGVTSPLAALELGLVGHPSQRIWRNFPPAVVWRFCRSTRPVAQVA
jgi:phosphatidylethanolamine/phosphatidyl-N-methylethanolamine N-methyltransferase